MKAVTEKALIGLLATVLIIALLFVNYFTAVFFKSLIAQQNINLGYVFEHLPLLLFECALFLFLIGLLPSLHIYSRRRIGLLATLMGVPFAMIHIWTEEELRWLAVILYIGYAAAWWSLAQNWSQHSSSEAKA
jgi:hypothetical protein